MNLLTRTSTTVAEHRRHHRAARLRREAVAARAGLLLALVLLVAVAGCSWHQRQDRSSLPLIPPAVGNPCPEPVAVGGTPPPEPGLAGPHPVEDYVQVALVRNPDIQAARKRVEALRFQVPVVTSLPDPSVTTIAQPAPVQTAAGEFQFILNANQKFPWFGKLATRGTVAEAEAAVARAELAAVELETVATVKRAYYELFYVQRAIAVTEAERTLLGQLRQVADTRYQTGQTSQQDVLRADLELSGIANNLIDLRQRQTTERARLARRLRTSPDTQLAALAELPDERLPASLDSLRDRAVAARPELHAALEQISRDRQAVALARLDYKPDMTLGFAWIDVADAGLAPSSNGQDAVLLTAGMNLPIYRRRLAAAVQSADAGTIASARRYDSLRDATVEDVTSLFAKARSHEEMLQLFHDDILPKATQTLEVSIEAYNVGEIDFLQLLDNWRQLLRYELGQVRLQADLRQVLADLERVVGGWGLRRPALGEAVATGPKGLPDSAAAGVEPLPVPDGP